MKKKYIYARYISKNILVDHKYKESVVFRDIMKLLVISLLIIIFSQEGIHLHTFPPHACADTQDHVPVQDIYSLIKHQTQAYRNC